MKQKVNETSISVGQTKVAERGCEPGMSRYKGWGEKRKK